MRVAGLEDRSERSASTRSFPSLLPGPSPFGKLRFPQAPLPMRPSPLAPLSPAPLPAHRLNDRVLLLLRLALISLMLGLAPAALG